MLGLNTVNSLAFRWLPSALAPGRAAGRRSPACRRADRQRRAGPDRIEASSSELTARQREVLRLLAQGRSMKQAAAVLGLTPRTVAFYKYQMIGKLRLESNAELMQFAIRQGVIT
jgi:DNA-binding CsgD family transcriptional regulator